MQRYEAELSLQVDDTEALSTATKRAQQIARSHGGSVASLQYDAPSAGVGTAQITLRVPTARVESAMAQLSQLGTIVGQRYGIDDLQQQADSCSRRSRRRSARSRNWSRGSRARRFPTPIAPSSSHGCRTPARS